jgi:isocitrate lyase
MFARDYAKRGMAAYVQLIQREERKHGVETMTHQKWRGAEIVDQMLQTVTSGMASAGRPSLGVSKFTMSG